MIWNGLKVVLSDYLTEPQPMRVTLPAGGGWLKHVTRIVQAPRREALQQGNTLIMHPAMWRELRTTLARSSEDD